MQQKEVQSKKLAVSFFPLPRMYKYRLDANSSTIKF